MGLRDRSLDAETFVSSVRCVAGLEGILSDVSCGNDLGDELALELENPVANPGAAIGTKFFVLLRIIWPFFGLAVVFDHWPTEKNIRVLRRACPTTGVQACHRGFAPSCRAQGSERFLVLPHLFALLRWL